MFCCVYSDWHGLWQNPSKQSNIKSRNSNPLVKIRNISKKNLEGDVSFISGNIWDQLNCFQCPHIFKTVMLIKDKVFCFHFIAKQWRIISVLDMNLEMNFKFILKYKGLIPKCFFCITLLLKKGWQINVEEIVLNVCISCCWWNRQAQTFEQVFCKGHDIGLEVQ